jgi:hypothetical protein
VLGRVGGRAADHVDAVGAQVVDGLLLGRVEVAGRHEVGAAAAQDHEQRRGLGLEVDPGADPRPLNGWVRSNSSPVALSSPALSATHSNRDISAG